jgi:(E)-4-hydroxy-3-methylbut-2-enyl-diphosphate synthase
MNSRIETRSIKIGNIILGGQDHVLIQSMCNVKTEKVDLVVKQINECAALGADLMRVSVMDEADAKAISEIKKHISIPLVADIHFDYRLALLAMENGADKIRINPGNIGSLDNVKRVVDMAKEKHIPIRI